MEPCSVRRQVCIRTESRPLTPAGLIEYLRPAPTPTPVQVFWMKLCGHWTVHCTTLHMCTGGKRSYGVKVEVDITVTTLRSSHPISPKLQFQCQAKSWWPVFPGTFMSGGSRCIKSKPNRKGSGPGKSQIDINLILVVLTRAGRGP